LLLIGSAASFEPANPTMQWRTYRYAMIITPGLTPQIAAEKFEAWVGSVSFSATICVLCHSDADGISAGAILYRALKRAGRTIATIVTGKFNRIGAYIIVKPSTYASPFR
jgi:hypothetical protein